jgi:F0F1-type ATP synthase epsilon subunit
MPLRALIVSFVTQIDESFQISGSFGILTNYSPLQAVLKPGVVTIFEND